MPGFDTSEERLEARRFIGRLVKRKFQIIAVLLAVVIPAAVYTYVATPLYRSAALIQINPDTVQVLPYKEIADLPNAAPYYEIYMKTQEQVLKSPTLTARVARRLQSDQAAEAMQAEIPRLRSRLEIRRIENSQLFEVSYLSPVPEAAANIVNIFAEEYIKELFQSRQETREKARKLLEGELRELEQRVQASEKELVQYARDHNMVTLQPGQADLVEQKLSLLANQLTESEAEIMVARSRLDSLKKASIHNFPERLLTPNLLSLSAKILQLEHELTALRTDFGENWPAVVQKRNEITLVRDQLNREKAAALAQAGEQAQLDLQAAESRRRLIADSMNQQRQLVDRYRNASIQYNILRREVETSQKLYEGLLERLKQTSVTAGLEFGNIHVVEPGRPGKTPDSPKVAWILSLASLLGLGLGVCFALVMDFWDNSISSIEEAEEIAALPALGSVPLIKSSKRGAPVLQVPAKAGASSIALKIRKTGSDKTSPGFVPAPEVAEAIRLVCSSILLSRSDHPPRVILVTSAAPSEGKTTIVHHLGQAFADSGNKTLLIESDMRKPALAKALGIANDGGLSLFLSGHLDPMPTIHATDNENLFVISAGPQAPNPPALLNSERLNQLLIEMSSMFQFVLLDAPPIFPVADARVLCSKVDGVVLVVKAGHTPKNLVRRAWLILENSGANVLGIVLNKATHNGYERAYYHHYHYYE
jgi:capsular exopolysaccharide synthesis family protein